MRAFHTVLISLVLSIFSPVSFASSWVTIHNMTVVPMSVSLNNGAFIEIESFKTRQAMLIDENNPGSGRLGLGDNAVTFYALDEGPAHAENHVLMIPLKKKPPRSNYFIIMPGVADTPGSQYAISQLFSH